MAKNDLTRRALLGRAALLGPLAALTVAAMPPGSAFAARLAAYDHARSEAERVCRLTADDDIHTACDAQVGVMERQEAAFDRLLAEPAPDQAAVDTKLRIVLAEYDGCAFDDTRLDSIRADLRRLGSR